MTNQDRTEIKNFVKAVRVEHDRRIANDYVAQEIGMSLCSDTEITRLAGMETGAQKNVIESVSIKGGLAGSIDSDSKVITLNLDDYAKKSDIKQGFTYKGYKNTFADLPSSGNTPNDVWNIKIAGGSDRFGTPVKAGDNVIYADANDTIPAGWDVFSGTTDLSGYVEVVPGKGLVADSLISGLQTLVDESDETFDAQDIDDIFA